MSKSKGGHSDGGFHQEYIASLRYRNELPPPEMPPKFLEIPHEGVRRFLTPEFASAMVRREEPNIDVDAEGGMPIDVVGLPGLHLGDESGRFPHFYIVFLIVCRRRICMIIRIDRSQCHSHHGVREPPAC